MYKRTSLLHNMAYLYAAYCHLTDGDVDKEELLQIGGRLVGWMKHFDIDLSGDGKIDGKDAAHLLFDIVVPYYDSMDNQSRISEFERILNTFKEQEWYSDKFASGLLLDLKELAEADGKYTDTEKQWIDISAEVFGVESPA
jgi:hypothetical protein